MSSRVHEVRPLGLAPMDPGEGEWALLRKQANALHRTALFFLEQLGCRFSLFNFRIVPRHIEFLIGQFEEFWTIIIPPPVADLRQDLVNALFYINEHPTYPLWFEASLCDECRKTPYNAGEAKQRIGNWLREIAGETGKMLYQMELLID